MIKFYIIQKSKLLSIILFILLIFLFLPPFSYASDNPNPPSNTTKLIFIHHSTGEAWLDDGNGGLGIALRDNHYFVSNTNYGWGPDSIGDNTDIGHWWNWFRGPNSSTYMSALYNESGQHCSYSRLGTNPGGENKIIMFKSCFPNSALQGSVSDPVPPISSNPLRGQGSGSSEHTVANAKGIYIDILEYFRTRQDKLFIVIAAPPLSDSTYSSNARAFNEWLVNDWLDGYSYKNVFVFDFYNVLTTNGGDANTNDLNQSSGNHHRWWNSAIQHKTDGDDDTNYNVLEYPTGDDHPSQAGNLKATAEFLPLLNIAYNRWKGGAAPPPSAKSMERLFGDTRYETAVAISQEGWTTSNTVILARGDLFPDALAGAPFAAKFNAPILLTNPESLTKSTADEIKRLKAKEIKILGSENAVYPKVVEDLVNQCGINMVSITRYGGPTRYETASQIANEIIPPPNKTCIIAYGENYPDALASASAAASKGMPILLVKMNEIPPSIRETLKASGAEKTIIVGGSDVVSDGVQNWLNDYGFNPIRLGGDTRYDTCYLIADYILKNMGMSANTIGVAYGENFPDALTLGPLSGKSKAPLLLVRDTFIPDKIKDFITAHKNEINHVYIAGGTDVVSDGVKDEIGGIIGI